MFRACRVCKLVLPRERHLFFLFLYLFELLLKTTAFGFLGGKFSYWTHNFYNKLDIVATLTYVVEVAYIYIFASDCPWSFRALRLFRLLKPVGQLGLFSELETIFESIIKALYPMAVVLSLILFVLVLYSIIGMTLYSKHFRRRCVWAHDLSLKYPEQWCSRDHKFIESQGCVAFGMFESSKTITRPIFVTSLDSQVANMRILLLPPKQTSSCKRFAVDKWGGDCQNLSL